MHTFKNSLLTENLSKSLQIYYKKITKIKQNDNIIRVVPMNCSELNNYSRLTN